MSKRVRVPLSPVPALHVRKQRTGTGRHIIQAGPGIVKKIARALWNEDAEADAHTAIDPDWTADVLAQLHAQGYDLLSRVEKVVIDKP